MTANSKILKQKSYEQISFKIKKEIANKSINNDFCVFVSKEITQLCERLNESSEYVFTAVWSLGILRLLITFPCFFLYYKCTQQQLVNLQDEKN